MEHDLNIYQMIFDTITVVAFIFGVMFTLIVIAQFIQAATYSEVDKLKDQMNGLTRTFPMLKPIVVMVICWSWVIAVWINS